MSSEVIFMNIYNVIPNIMNVFELTTNLEKLMVKNWS